MRRVGAPKSHWKVRRSQMHSYLTRRHNANQMGPTGNEWHRTAWASVEIRLLIALKQHNRIIVHRHAATPLTIIVLPAHMWSKLNAFHNFTETIGTLPVRPEFSIFMLNSSHNSYSITSPAPKYSSYNIGFQRTVIRAINMAVNAKFMS